MRTIGILMNGVTGRMGTNQHLKRSIAALRYEGGLALRDGTRVLPDPVLIGRSEEKLRALANECGIERWSTDLNRSLQNPGDVIYFDAQTTSRRAADVMRALNAGKHVYCEKPLASSLDESLALAQLAKSKGLKNGIVQDKLFLPGLLKLKRLIDSKFFGRILAARGEFGYWVFEGEDRPSQRPSWNYRKEDGGGITLDMFGHWQYVLSGLFGPIASVSAQCATHIPTRIDEMGHPYQATADDAVYALFTMQSGMVVQMNSSWATRVYRDDLFTLQVDGTEGSAIAGLRECKIQPRTATPRAVWNPDLPVGHDYFSSWRKVEDGQVYGNAFRAQWELFLRHVLEDGPFPYDFLAGARGVQLAELGEASSVARCTLAIPELEVE